MRFESKRGPKEKKTHFVSWKAFFTRMIAKIYQRKNTQCKYGRLLWNDIFSNIFHLS